MNKGGRIVSKSKSALVKGSKVKKSRGKPGKVTLVCPYSVDEKVLCYEPDPKKSKVLYEAKILKITSSLDSLGNTEFQFLVHFQGWNSSWDRFVADDLLVKDTEESRKLQDELNQLAAAYRKKGKQKGGKHADSSLSDVAPPLAKRPKLHNTRRPVRRGQHVDIQFIQLKDVEPDGTEGGGNEVEEDFNIEVTLLEPLTQLLELDYRKIHQESKLPRLPAPVSVAQILEQFVRQTSFTKLERWHKKFKWGVIAARSSASGSKYVPVSHGASTSNFSKRSKLKTFTAHEVKLPDQLLKIMNEVEVMQQLAFDMALMFDCYVESILLYNTEKGKYHQCLTNRVTLHASRPTEVPEGLQFSKLDKTSQAGSELRVGAATSNETDLREVAGDCEEVLVEFHCRQGIWKLVQQLVSWSLTDSEPNTCPKPSVIFGVTHLLRLLVKMPEILVKTDIQKPRLLQVTIFVNLLVAYILKEFKEYQMLYDDASTEVPMEVTLE